MTYSLFSIIPWFLISGSIVALHITSAVILLRERHLGAWLMLSGSGISLLGLIANMVLPAFIMRSGSPNVEIITANVALSSLGGLLFGVGLLLHALRQRGKSNRISELEGIIASIQNR